MRALLGSALLWRLSLVQLGLAAAALIQESGKARGSALDGLEGSGATVDVSRPLSCLRLTTPGLELRYPEDAEAHMEEIRSALRPWQALNVYGRRDPRTHARPKIYYSEHQWMTFYLTWREQKGNGSKLSDVFGPYVPIFTHWVWPWFNHWEGKPKFQYPKEFLETLRKVLRKDVPYVTVSQNDEGIVGKRCDNLTLAEFPNVLVFSAGGYGHVPVPLWQQLPDDSDSEVMFKVPNYPRPQRLYFLSYVGSFLHAPRNMRNRTMDTIAEWSTAHGLKVTHEPDLLLYKLNILRAMKENWEDPDPVVQFPETEAKVVFYHNSSRQDKAMWQEIMFSSRFSLTPRGFGRTSYHMVEIMWAGLIPIHVYTDQPWLPYRKIFDTFGFHTDVAGLPTLLDRLRSMTDEEFKAREARVRAHFESHWMPQRMAGQLFRFMSGRDPFTNETGTGDLICQRLPKTVTDA